MNLNKVQILGRVTADPQLRSTQSGQAVTSFSVATNRYWKGKDGNRQEETEFHNVVAWGRQAEIAAQYLVKGALVYVEGRLQTRKWQDKQGQDRRTTEIICENIQLGPKAAGGGGPSAPKGAAGGEFNSADANKETTPEEIPVINLDEDGKTEDLPF